MKHNLRFLLVCLLILISNIYIQGQNKSPLYEEYIKKYRAIAIKQQKEYKIPASITLAQGLLESSAGKSQLTRVGNNHFGIKCKSEWKGKRMYYDDDEKNECFRRYRNAEESYEDHSMFLANRKYYVSLFDLDIYDYKGWAYGLQRCGYATDKKYGEKLVRIIETYELYDYDRGIIDKAQLADDIYEIKIDLPEELKNNSKRFSATGGHRKIYKINNVHYIIAQENDTYNIIAYDLRVTAERLVKYNETTKEHKLEKGDIVYLQKKKKYAEKKYNAHVVLEGESIYSISQLYGIRIKSLYKLNKLKDTYIPKPGDLLKVRK